MERSAGISVTVTVEDAFSVGECMRIIVSSRDTVKKIKENIHHKASHLSISDQNLLLNGRLLYDYEAIHDLLLDMNDVSNVQEKSLQLDLIYSPSSHLLGRDYHRSQFSSVKKQSPLLIDAGSVDAAKAHLTKSRSSNVLHPSDVILQTTLDSLLLDDNFELYKSERIVEAVDQSPVETTHDVEHTTAGNRYSQDGVVPENEDVPIELPPPAIVFDDEEEFPRIFRLEIVFRIAFALMIFGRDYSVTALALASTLFYVYEVGLMGYIYRRYVPQTPPPPPPGVGAHENIGAFQAQPHDQQRLYVEDENWSLSRLLRILQSPGIPRGAGPVMDMVALLVGFFCSLFPSWNID